MKIDREFISGFNRFLVQKERQEAIQRKIDPDIFNIQKELRGFLGRTIQQVLDNCSDDLAYRLEEFLEKPQSVETLKKIKGKAEKYAPHELALESASGNEVAQVGTTELEDDSEVFFDPGTWVDSHMLYGEENMDDSHPQVPTPINDDIIKETVGVALVWTEFNFTDTGPETPLLWGTLVSPQDKGQQENEERECAIEEELTKLLFQLQANPANETFLNEYTNLWAVNGGNLNPLLHPFSTVARPPSERAFDRLWN